MDKPQKQNNLLKNGAEYIYYGAVGGGLIAQLCPTFCDTMDCSPWAPLSKGFSRQEYWSGLPRNKLLIHTTWMSPNYICQVKEAILKRVNTARFYL